MGRANDNFLTTSGILAERNESLLHTLPFSRWVMISVVIWIHLLVRLYKLCVRFANFVLVIFLVVIGPSAADGNSRLASSAGLLFTRSALPSFRFFDVEAICMFARCYYIKNSNKVLNHS